MPLFRHYDDAESDEYMYDDGSSSSASWSSSDSVEAKNATLFGGNGPSTSTTTIMDNLDTSNCTYRHGIVLFWELELVQRGLIWNLSSKRFSGQNDISVK